MNIDSRIHAIESEWADAGDDVSDELKIIRELRIELHDLKHAIREAMVRIEGEKCDLSEGAGSHEVLHNAGVQRDLDIIKQCCGEFL